MSEIKIGQLGNFASPEYDDFPLQWKALSPVVDESMPREFYTDANRAIARGIVSDCLHLERSGLL
jgi:hypothetical protein